jgi:outer membrane receptor protein involved in Fe transport
LPIPLPAGTFSVPILIEGDPALEPQTIDALEIGYTANIAGRATASASLYRQKSNGPINLQVAEVYSPADPPPGWPLPPFVLEDLALPQTFRFMGIGSVAESGFEASLDVTAAPGVTASGSYSWQARPEVTGSTPTGPVAVNIPPRNRFDIGLSVARGRLMLAASAGYTDRAVWTDVLGIRAETGAFWLLNGTLGVRFAAGRANWLVKGTNLANSPVQQHAFGDIIRRRLMTELRFRF